MNMSHWKSLYITHGTILSIPKASVKFLSYFTAKAWSFWFMHITPSVLQIQFTDPKYHQHLCNLMDIMKTCLQFEITKQQIDELEAKIHIWVDFYEE
jgi:hypothetical protein